MSSPTTSPPRGNSAIPARQVPAPPRKFILFFLLEITGIAAILIIIYLIETDNLHTAAPLRPVSRIIKGAPRDKKHAELIERVGLYHEYLRDMARWETSTKADKKADNEKKLLSPVEASDNEEEEKAKPAAKPVSKAETNKENAVPGTDKGRRRGSAVDDQQFRLARLLSKAKAAKRASFAGPSPASGPEIKGRPRSSYGALDAFCSEAELRSAIMENAPAIPAFDFRSGVGVRMMSGDKRLSGIPGRANTTTTNTPADDESRRA